MVVCFYMLNLGRAGNMSRVHPVPCSKADGMAQFLEEHLHPENYISLVLQSHKVQQHFILN